MDPMDPKERHRRKQRSHRPWDRRKAAVLRRSTICHLCGHDGSDTADHLVPVTLGGLSTLDNLRPVHHTRCPTCGQACNRVRGTGSVAAAQAKLSGFTNSQDW